jgi:hypothetical protein
MNRQLRMGGGIMNAVPRENYGLGSAFKSITKGVKSAVKGAAGAVKDVVKSDIGKAALLAAGAYYAPAMFGGTVGFGPGTTYGSFARGLMSPGLIGPMTKAGSLGRGISSALTGGGLGKTLGVFAAGSLLPTILGQAEETGEAEVLTRDVGALRAKLTQAYKLQRTFSDAPDEDAAIAAQVEADVSEYTSGAGGYANGGRIGFQQGGNFDFNKFLQDRTREAMQVEGIGQAIRPVVESNVRAQAARDLSQARRGGGIESFLRGQLGSGIIPGMSAIQSPMSGTSNFGRKLVLDALTKSYMKPYAAPTDSVYDQMRFAQPGQSGSFVQMPGGQFGDGMGIVIDGKRYSTEQEAIDDVGAERYSMFYADGGRIGYAYGDRAEDNAMQASNAMGLPLNQNPAGVTELDLRETGGFIPPVGVKEKADDIPAMLSNNEFVFTADAVRGMGDGDVNKGAQRMYDMMKKLENGGIV